MDFILQPEQFPELLKNITDPPQKLYCRGQTLQEDRLHIAIVGTRRASAYGKQIAYDIAKMLAARGCVIVSGLAFGIDSCAHRGALDARGLTIGVLGSGLNIITPTANIGLAQEIAKNGTLITEYQPNYPAAKHTFPMRNRIIAGLSKAVIVIEAPDKSGALITARLALEYNRDVIAVPANITSMMSAGSNRMIRDGKAHPVAAIEDVLTYLALDSNNNFEKNHFALDSPEAKIFDCISAQSPQLIDAIVRETGLPIQTVNATITMLEIEGLIVRDGSYVFVTR